MYSYDINSSYPHQMTKPLPGGRAVEFDVELGLEKLFGFALATVTVPSDPRLPAGYIPPLPIRANENGTGMIFPTGTFKTFAFSEELKAAKAVGCEVTLHEAIAFDPIFPHKKFVEHFHKQKDLLKGQPAKRATVKGILNTSYGRLALQLPLDVVSICGDQELFESLSTYSGVNYTPLPLIGNKQLYLADSTVIPHLSLRHRDYKLYKKAMAKIEAKAAKHFVSIPYAAAITSYARIALLEGM